MRPKPANLAIGSTHTIVGAALIGSKHFHPLSGIDNIQLVIAGVCQFGGELQASFQRSSSLARIWAARTG
ncbi:MAG: hypothetical protein JXA13_07335, partial [Anaerolineales bacterium]|nr:hypothetical protein [Anaerolineales bacterium]